MKVAVFYYSQSGQALNAVKSICSVFQHVEYKQIVPLQDYPFPWNKDEFFDTFPETRLGIPPSGIKPMDFSDIEDADLVFVVGQSWFLSPSLPLQSFFADEQVRSYLKGRHVVFVNVCRNMWLMTGRKVKGYLKEMNARLIGHIVMQDNAPNLVSALTIVRWLLYGKKQPSWMLPGAGVSASDISGASKFGEIILEACGNNDFSMLQEKLLSAGAIKYNPSILFLEKMGHRMFGLWAKFIRMKGGFRDARRLTRVNLFFYYLLIVLFVVSPFAQLVFYLTWPLRRVGKHRLEDCSL